MQSVINKKAFLLAAAVAAATSSAQDALNIGSQAGAQIFFYDTLNRTFNFGVTSSGESAGITISKLNVELKKEAGVTADVVLKIYDGFGGTGNVLGTYTIAASNFSSSFNPYSLTLGTPLVLTSGDYSLVMSSATTSADRYFFKAGQLKLTDSQGNLLTSGFWVPDSRTDGTATTSLATSSPVLADHSVDLTTVSFGNFRLGATLSQAVALTNSAFATSNNLTEALTITGNSLTGVTLGTGSLTSGNAATFLNQGQSTNMVIGLSSATAGVRTGTAVVNFGSVKGGSASSNTGVTAVGNRTINVSGTGYRAAAAAFDKTTVNLGNRRVTETNVTDVVSVSNTATNDAYSEKLKLAVASASGATVGSMPASIAAGSSSNVTVGLATISAGSNSGTVTLSRTSDGTGTSGLSDLSLGGNQAITVNATGYRAASANFSTTSLDLGKFHTGTTNVAGTTTVSNAVTNDAYSEKLKLAVASASGATVGSMPASIAAGSSSNVTVGIASIVSAGAHSGTVTLGLESDGTGTSGLSALGLGSQVINVSATGYTGQSTWNTDANGVWNSFAGWDNDGGKPGVDGNLSTNDTATFGSAATVARTITLGSAIPTLRTLNFDNSTASYYIAAGGAGRLQLGTSAGSGAINVNSGHHTVSAGLELAQATTATVASGSRLVLSGALDGAGSLTKTGAGTLLVDGTGTLSGSTTVSAGLLSVNGSIADSSINVTDGGTLGGSGTVGSTSIQSGGTLAPGNSPGDLSITGDETWYSNGNYNWQLYDASGVAGTAWDITTISGNLDLSNLTSGSPFNINLWTLSGVHDGPNGADTDGLAINFNNAQSYTWTIARVGGAILGFSQALFNINLSAANGTAGFANDLGGGTISIVQDGKDLNLVFQPIPEPSTYGLMLGGVALALVALRRRRRA